MNIMLDITRKKIKTIFSRLLVNKIACIVNVVSVHTPIKQNCGPATFLLISAYVIIEMTYQFDEIDL